MGVRSGIVIVLVSLYFMCTWDSLQGHFSENDNDNRETPDRWIESTDRDIFYVDIMQRTCALEVVHRAEILAGPSVLDGFADLPIEEREAESEKPMLACVQTPKTAEDGIEVNFREE